MNHRHTDFQSAALPTELLGHLAAFGDPDAGAGARIIRGNSDIANKKPARWRAFCRARRARCARTRLRQHAMVVGADVPIHGFAPDNRADIQGHRRSHDHVRLPISPHPSRGGGIRTGRPDIPSNSGLFSPRNNRKHCKSRVSLQCYRAPRVRPCASVAHMLTQPATAASVRHEAFGGSVGQRATAGRSRLIAIIPGMD